MIELYKHENNLSYILKLAFRLLLNKFIKKNSLYYNLLLITSLERKRYNIELSALDLELSLLYYAIRTI